MAEEITGGTSGAAVAEPVGQTAPAATETPSQNGQADTQVQSAPAEESFSSIDPKTLTPELQAVYKSLQADYTKKTMSIADTRKKAEAFDKVTSRSDFKDWWGGASKVQKADFKEQKAEVEKTLGQKITDERFQQAFQTKDGFLDLIAEVAKDIGGKSQSKIDQLEQKLSIKDAESFVENFATEMGKDGKPVRPDFYALDEDRLITGYLQLSIDPAKGLSQEEYSEKLNEAYGWAKNLSQKYYDKGKSDALQVIQKKAAASSEPPTGGAKGAYTGPDPKKITAAEALQMAKRGERVPRND